MEIVYYPTTHIIVDVITKLKTKLKLERFKRLETLFCLVLS